MFARYKYLRVIFSYMSMCVCVCVQVHVFLVHIFTTVLFLSFSLVCVNEMGVCRLFLEMMPLSCLSVSLSLIMCVCACVCVCACCVYV